MPPTPPAFASYSVVAQRALLGRAVAVAALLIFGGIAVGQWQPYTFLHGDGAFYANINKSIWRDGTLDQSRYHPHTWLEEDLGWNKNLDQGWSNVSLGKDGRWLPKHSWVMPLVATPLYATFGLGGLLIFHILMLTALVTASYLIAARFVDPPLAAVGALVVAAQPVIAGDVYSYNNDMFYAALLAVGTACFLAAFGAGDPAPPPKARRRRLEIAAGLLLGLGVWAKVTNLVYILPFGCWLLWRREPGSIRRCLGAFAVPIGLFLATNAALFGSPFATSYSRILVRVDGQLATESIADRFKEPLKAGLVRVLTDEGEGLDGKAPLLAIALFGGALLLARPRTRVVGACFMAVFAAFLVVQAKYGFTYARFFLPVVGLSVLPVAAVLQFAGQMFPTLKAYFRPKIEGRWNPAFAGLLAVGVALALQANARWNPRPALPFHLVDHLESARVFMGDALPPPSSKAEARTRPRDRRRCDYFNNLHQKFECTGDKGGDQMWGRAVGDECTFGGQKQRLLFLHPPRGRGARTLEIDVPPGDRLRVRYGLADSSRFDDVAFEIGMGGVKLPIPPVTRRGALFEHEISGLATLSSPLTITVRNPPLDWRHFCIDATVLE